MARAALTLSLSSNLLTLSRLSFISRRAKFSAPSRLFPAVRTLCSAATAAETVDSEQALNPLKHSMLLERLRLRNLKDPSAKPPPRKARETGSASTSVEEKKKGKAAKMVGSFEELGVSVEVLGAVKEQGIEVPTEIQCIGIPAVLEGKSVVLGSHTGSGKTLAYLLPLVQLLRRDEELHGILMKPRRPRAVVLCPTRELSEQVFRVAKSISHHARFRVTMVSGGGRIKPQEDSLNHPVDMVVGTPGRVLQHIEEGNMVYGDIKYVVLDEADTMFDHGFGPDIRKFIAPLKNRILKTEAKGFQTVLVTATMTAAVQKLVDEEFEELEHLRTSTLHKKVAAARHDFIKLAGSENKLESLLQVLEPSLTKGNKVMVFCNTLNSSRAVDHFLSENQISTVNYHGEVPAEQRVKNLEKFKAEDGDCPTLVCTDLAARGLDLDVDHVIMFDFPLNSIDYLHRTGRTARMGAKGKVTSLVTRKDQILASRIEEAMKKNESLESLSTDGIRRDIARTRINDQRKGMISPAKPNKPTSDSKSKGKFSSDSVFKGKAIPTRRSGPSARSKASTSQNSSKKFSSGKPKFSVAKPVKVAAKSEIGGGSKSGKPSSGKPSFGKPSFDGKKKKQGGTKSPAKLSVVGFRGKNSSSSSRRGVGY